MRVIAFILVLFLSSMDVFVGKPKYIEEEVSLVGSISGMVKCRGPKKDVRIDLMKEKMAKLVKNIQRLKTE